MTETEAEADDRMYQAFLRGYREFAAASGVASATVVVPYTPLISAAALESKELRRSIDACRAALAQLTALPAAEQEQLKTEARASLGTLQSATERLLARLRSLRVAPPPETPPTVTAAAAAARPAPVRARKTRSRR